MATWVPELGAWEVRRRAEVLRVLADTRTFSAADSLPAPPVPALMRRRLGRAFPWTIGSLVNDDSPAHAPLRKRVAPAFTRRRAAAMEPVIAARAERLVAAVEPRGEADLLATVAMPLAEATVADVAGFAPADIPAIHRWLEALDVSVAPEGAVPASERLAAAEEHAAFCARCAALIADRRGTDGDDLAARLAGVPTRVAISAMLQTVMGGVASPAQLIAHGVLLGLAHPGCWDGLRADPARAGDVVEEALRHASVVHATQRRATRPAALDGADVSAGDCVHVVLGAANRELPDGDAFSPGRPGARNHLAFGRGMHFCLGAALARTEAAAALRALARLDGLRLAPGERPERWPLPTLNALRALRVEWSPRA